MTDDKRSSEPHGRHTSNITYPAERISPPPLKRQRVRLEDDHTIPDRSRAPAISGYSTSHRGDALTSVNVNKRADGSSRHSSSWASHKPRCRVCMKDTNVRYDPIITCSTCPRQYHDSCRKPPLAEGTEPRDWRCFKCEGGDLGGASKIKKLHARDSDAFEPAMKVAARPLPGSLNPVPVHSLSTKTTDNAEQIPNQVPDPHKNGDAHVPADDCGDQRKSTDRHLHQELSAKRSLGGSTLTTSDEIISGCSLNSANSHRRFSGASKSPNKSPISGHVHTACPERIEVPNTPTQRSSQLNIPSSLVDLGCAATQEVVLRSGGSPHVEPPPPTRITFATVLCTVCHKQRLLAKSGSQSAVCQKCQDQHRVGAPKKLEIPETPESSAASQKPQHEQTPAAIGQRSQLEKVTTAATQLKPQDVTVPWFESGVVATTPKIKQKVCQLAHLETLSEQDMTSERNILPCPEDTVLLSEGANAMSQVYQDTTRQLASTNESSPRIDQPSSREREKIDDSNQPTLLSHGKRTKDGIHSGPPSNFSRSRSEASTPVSISGSITDDTADSEMEYLLPETSESKDPQISTGSALDSRQKPPIQGQFTIRELTRIALVSANGSRMMTSQIFAWIARTFSHLRVGEGGWERSVQASLSRCDEFDGRTIPGARGNKKLYGFSDDETRKRYETEYSEFLPTFDPISRTEQKASRENKNYGKEQVSVKRALKSAPSRSSLMTKQAHTSVPTERHGDPVQNKLANSAAKPGVLLPSLQTQTEPIATEPPISKAPPEEASNNPSTPFKRSTPHQLPGRLNLNQDVKRETTFEAAFADLKPSIEIMTEEEKARKIAEIKARPSRKKYFGSDHRLAHKRRFGLEDVHDERDGAWKPRRPTTDELHQSAKGVDMDSEKAQTLRGLFGLPENVIPMNDGFTELAFRDGTLVNGRLPRPRNVYKVGKLFGGELTVRMS